VDSLGKEEWGLTNRLRAHDALFNSGERRGERGEGRGERGVGGAYFRTAEY
jgi:hypothetical protein